MLAETKQNIQKLQEQENESIAEGLDNKASFKTIIGAIDAKRKNAKTILNYINCTVRRRNQSSQSHISADFLFPAQPRNEFSDTWDGGINLGFLETFSHKSLMPWMVTTIDNIGQSDPVTELLKRRYKWLHKWTIFKQTYWSIRKNKYKWFDDDILYCPKFFTQMAEHLVTKPDNFFEDAYNWYYAGNGNLLIAQIDGSDYLIHSEFNTLYVSPFFKDTFSIDYTNTASYKCSEEANILETVHSLNIIALRTKYKVVILKINTTNNFLELDRLKEMDSELPFTGISMDKFHKNILYVTTLDSLATIVNLDRMTQRHKKLRGKILTLVDNWNTVIGSERGFYTHVNKKALTLYDKRTNEPYQRWKTFGFVSDIQICGKISAVKFCEGKPLCYVATDHHLFLMDMRCGKTKDNNIKPIQRWTHGMMSPPTYLDICVNHHTNTETVCLSSQWVEDMCLVNNGSDTLSRTGEINSLALPYRPPSILQTFNEAQRKRLCCSLYEPIQPRLCTTITGNLIVDQGENYAVLQQNSLGDISCHTLYPAHMSAFIEDDSIEKLYEWSKNYKEIEKPFEVTNIIDIRILLKQLCQVPDDYTLGKNSVIEERVKFNESEIYETYMKEELDPEFLEVWKDCNEEITLDKTHMSQFFVDA